VYQISTGVIMLLQLYNRDNQIITAETYLINKFSLASSYG